MNIYVASSWRNNKQPDVVRALREAGHSVYDFKNPAPGEHGFTWSEIDPDWKNWTPEKYIAALENQIAEHGFGRDFSAMQWAHACVLVLPSGRSAHIEAGWFVGAGKPLVILVEKMEPELMYKMADAVCVSIGEVIALLTNLTTKALTARPTYDAMRRELECYRFACHNVSAEWDEMRTALADVCAIDPTAIDPHSVVERVAAYEAAVSVLERHADHGDVAACTTASRQRNANSAKAGDEYDPPMSVLDCTACGWPFSQHSTDGLCPSKTPRPHRLGRDA